LVTGSFFGSPVTRTGTALECGKRRDGETERRRDGETKRGKRREESGEKREGEKERVISIWYHRH
jgi:hypothetical protein